MIISWRNGGLFFFLAFDGDWWFPASARWSLARTTYSRPRDHPVTEARAGVQVRQQKNALPPFTPEFACTDYTAVAAGAGQIYKGAN